MIGIAGEDVRIPKSEDAYDLVALRDHLRARRGIDPNERAMVVTADDGVAYAELIRAMDVLGGTGYQDVTISGTH